MSKFVEFEIFSKFIKKVSDFKNYLSNFSGCQKLLHFFLNFFAISLNAHIICFKFSTLTRGIVQLFKKFLENSLIMAHQPLLKNPYIRSSQTVHFCKKKVDAFNQNTPEIPILFEFNLVEQNLNAERVKSK